VSLNNVLPGWMARDLFANVHPLAVPAEINTSDWREAFFCASTPARCIVDAVVALDSFTREDVVLVVACAQGERDGASWVGVFELKDGRYAMVQASCDYTGWDCRRTGHAEVARSLSDIVRFSLGQEDRDRLRLRYHNEPPPLARDRIKEGNG
jgi:hypothetical protein